MKITFMPPEYNGFALLIGRDAFSKAVLIIISPKYINSLTPTVSNSNIAISKNHSGGIEVNFNNIGTHFYGIIIGDSIESISYY